MEILQTVILLLVIFFQIHSPVLAREEQHYYNVIKHENKSLGNPERDFGARSQIECLLRCQRIQGKMGFYGNDGQCFCVSDVNNNNGSEMISGNTYSKVRLMILSYIGLFFCPVL